MIGKPVLDLKFLYYLQMPSENKVADESLHFQRYTNFLIELQLFLEGSPLNFSYPKKPGQNNKYDTAVYCFNDSRFCAGLVLQRYYVK